MEQWKEKENGWSLPGCSCMTLTSDSGKPYWFRTCDVDFDLRKEGAHPVRIAKGQQLIYEGGKIGKSNYEILGMTYNQKDTWILDGINEEGLCGGLLMLSEGRGKKGENGPEEIMAMEAVCYLLSCCKNVREAAEEAERIRITDIFYDGNFLPATVHYYFVDAKADEIILEPVIEKEPGRLKIYRKESSLGVMTNSPSYDLQKENLSWFLAKNTELKEKGKENCLRCGEAVVKAEERARHLSVSGAFPGSFASYDRFIRLAVFKSLNDSGRIFSDEKIIPRGMGIMNTVREPENQGFFHYSELDLQKEDGEKVTGRKNSRTEYTVAYDIEERKIYLSWFDTLEWTCYTLEK